MALGDVHYNRVSGILPSLERGIRLLVIGPLFGRERFPVIRRVLPGPPFRFDERVRRSPLTPRLILVPSRFEPLKQVLHIHPSDLLIAGKAGQCHIDGTDHGLGTLHALSQAFALVE
jgi:hypothetical protein